jgi:tRNA pseudouridine13 synthase
VDTQSLYAVADWPRFLGLPRIAGKLKMQAEDFRVEELPRSLPSGEGPHLWLEVQKRGANTDWVAGQLATLASCAARDVGYAGMKDRHAITSQWFSVPVSESKELNWREWDIPDVQVMQAERSQRKLKRGSLNGNRFTIVLRELQGDLDDLESRLSIIKGRGCPNYFGPQRFGHAGRNVPAAVNWLFNGGRLPRAKRSIFLSAARSFLFNHVLAKRVEQDNWDKLLTGEVIMLDGSRSVFHAKPTDQDLHQRCAEFDIHPTGPLAGDGGMLVTDAAASVEIPVLEPYSDLIAALSKARVTADRRSLRLKVTGLEWDIKDQQLMLSFTLPAGAYATTVINELVSADN